MAKPHTALAYRVVVALLGAFVVLIGLALVPLPGPGWLIVIIGLFVISTEFHWARHVLQFVRTNVERWSRWIMAQPVWVRWTVGAVTLAFVAVVVWAVVRLIGLPHWVPELEVLRRLDLQ
ncbi:uncharacterized protein (TIGR02611 family) [Brevibacterium sanguinis]|uniref:Uncharacterized protein (TIGR02611 family) n=2 Tax=Brevibacterium TaxID=1696 RepID=A0A366IGV9_9MICO|nr:MULTISPECIES: TIGR02611 family protein [Brevibacterium]RBP63926.1 uncharacterized protein (TIGR02611 family) [Brevibacterium sanguinis]RBP70799.1 uncharacterized protein (TIGR02611 family) [Brevibacterium celere]